MSPTPAPVPIYQQAGDVLRSNQAMGNSSGTSANSAGPLPPSARTHQFSPDFWENYEHACALLSTVPLQSIKSCISLDGSVNLALSVDRLKTNDWEPLFSTLKVNKHVKSISLVSSYTSPNDTDSSEMTRTAKSYYKQRKPPTIRSKEMTNKLCKALKECLTVSTHLEKLELINIPFSFKDCAQLAKGLRLNKSLKYLSLERCLIGDDGLNIICKDIQGLSNLNRVNFTACNLTQEGAATLAALIKVQGLKRHNEAWKDSLRYGRPELDQMFGIRRITINSNPQIGDLGVKELAEAFKSDLWLKALDMQNCGITTQGADYLLDGLKFNAMMHVLDVRLNRQIDRDTLQKIMELVMINSSGSNTEYEWLDLNQSSVVSAQSPKVKTRETIPPKIKKRRTTNSSFNKKPQFNMSINSIKMKRCKSTGSVVCSKSPGGIGESKTPTSHQSSGIPWRTAARATNRYRATNCAFRNENGEYYLDEENDEDDDDDQIDEESENEDEQLQKIIENLNLEQKMMPVSDDMSQHNKFGMNHSYDDLAIDPRYASHPLMASSTFVDSDKFSNVKNKSQQRKKQPQYDAESMKLNDSRHELVSNLDKIRNASAKDLLTILQKEQELKSQLEKILIQLQNENTKLKSQISFLRSKVDQQQQQITILQKSKSDYHQGAGNTSTMNRTLLDDDRALEIIELTLHKYQQFLDFLRNAGFGKLIEYSGINKPTKPASSKAKSSGVKSSSKSPSSKYQKLSDEQNYFKEKIERTLSKMNETSELLDESNRQHFAHRSFDHQSNSTFLNYEQQDNMNIDTLLSNALEISRSYRRMNSSSLNNSTATLLRQRGTNNNHELSEIEEANRETSGASITLNPEEDSLPNIDEIQKSTQNLVEQLNSLKSIQQNSL